MVGMVQSILVSGGAEVHPHSGTLKSILVFVGLKMAWLNRTFGGARPLSWSLSSHSFLASLLSLWLMLPVGRDAT